MQAIDQPKDFTKLATQQGRPITGCNTNWEYSMKPIQVVTPTPAHTDPPTQALLDLAALASELRAEGASMRDLFARTGVYAGQIEDEHTRISFKERLAIYLNAKRLAHYDSIRKRNRPRPVGEGSVYGRDKVGIFAVHEFKAMRLD
jgi:hypothetical protein